MTQPLVPTKDIELCVDGNDDRFYSSLHTFALESKVPPFEMVGVYNDDLGRCHARLNVISPKEEDETGIINGDEGAARFGELWKQCFHPVAFVSRKWIIGISEFERVLVKDDEH
jgi:hypothetical protein